MPEGVPAALPALRQTLDARFSTVKQALPGAFTQAEIELFAPGDPDALLEELAALAPDHEAVLDEQMPYWAQLWPSAVALSLWILEEPSLLCVAELSKEPNDRSVLPPAVIELGCGLGLPAVVAAKQGAQVTCTDLHQDAVDFALLNIGSTLSAAPPLQAEPDRGYPECRGYTEYRGHPEYRGYALDWRGELPAESYDVILAADVVYETRFFDAVLRCFDHFLAPGGTILFAEPGRKVAVDFPERLLAHGFEIQTQSNRELEDHTIALFQLGRPVAN